MNDQREVLRELLRRASERIPEASELQLQELAGVVVAFLKHLPDARPDLSCRSVAELEPLYWPALPTPPFLYSSIPSSPPHVAESPALRPLKHQKTQLDDIMEVWQPSVYPLVEGILWINTYALEIELIAKRPGPGYLSKEFLVSFATLRHLEYPEAQSTFVEAMREYSGSIPQALLQVFGEIEWLEPLAKDLATEEKDLAS